MWNKPTDRQLSKLPRLYETEDIPIKDKIIYQHYFTGNCDWYMAEYCPKERLFFCYAVLGQDYHNAEWGYTSLDDLEGITVKGVEVDRELRWKPMKFIDIPEIKKGDAYD